MAKKYNIGIDATRNRSGGAVVHLINILKFYNPEKGNIDKIHLWSYKKLLDQLEDYPWLIKHAPTVCEQGMVKQLKWQRNQLPKELKKESCKLLFSPLGGTICRSFPYLTMSRDLLSYERKELARYFFSKEWLRLFVLKYVQLSSFKNSNGTIFLTQYAKDTIAKHHAIDYQNVVINHGISDAFRINKINKINLSNEKEIVVSYVSNADLYKHNWNVIEAVARFRKATNLNIKLKLIGAKEGHPTAIKQIKEAKQKFVNNFGWLDVTSRVNHDELVVLLGETDLFVFASTCENMPNTLIEGMSTGLPVICSSYGPMPEVIGEGTVFFNPEEVDTLVKALDKMIFDDAFRLKAAEISYKQSLNFSWEKCARLTFEFINKNLVDEH